MPLWVFIIWIGLLVYLIVFTYLLFLAGDWFLGGVLALMISTVVVRAAIGAKR